MTEFRIHLFGQVSVHRDGRSLSGLPAKALELLCYLFLNRDRAHTRESLADRLWPDSSDSVSRKYLRQAIWQLHSVIDALSLGEEPGRPTLLTLRPGWVRLNPQAGWWLDVAAFEQAYGLYRDTPGEDLTDTQARALESAVVLYRGDLIETWYQDWCLYERDRLRLTYLAMVEQMMGYCEAQQLYARGVAYGHRILRYEPARESTYRQLIRLHYLAGDRTTALRQYEHCVSALAKHFSLEPSLETVILYQQVRADRVESPARRPAAAAHPGGEPGSDQLLGLHARLDQIQASLAALHRDVQREMAEISRLTGRETLEQTQWQTS
jgi:DNA-binding SARP family transcriptional activator